MVKLEHIPGWQKITAYYSYKQNSAKPVDVMDTLPFPVAVICLPFLYQWIVGGGDPDDWQLSRKTFLSLSTNFSLGRTKICGFCPLTLQQTTPVMSLVWWHAVWKYASTQQLASIRPPRIQDVWPTFLCGQSLPIPAKSSYKYNVMREYMICNI